MTEGVREPLTGTANEGWPNQISFPRREMTTTIDATVALTRKLSAEGISGLDIRPTYPPLEHQDAEGEIAVYLPGMRKVIASEIVRKEDDPEAVAERILGMVRAAGLE